MTASARATLPRETVDALEALERLHHRYHTVGAEEVMLLQKALLAGTDVEASLGFEYLKVPEPPTPPAEPTPAAEGAAPASDETPPA